MCNLSSVLDARALRALVWRFTAVFSLVVLPLQTATVYAQPSTSLAANAPVSAVAPLASPPVNFSQATKLFTATTNTNYRFLQTADFNNDGKLDFIVATDGGMSISLGNGDDTFQNPTPINCGVGNDCSTSLPAPNPIVGDFNNGNKVDIATLKGNNFKLFYGKGDATFQAPVLYDNGFAGYNILSADCNGNGKTDLITYGNNNLSVLLDNGSGAFQTPITTTFNTTTNVLTVGDFSGDGKCDLITFSNNALKISIGNGNGTFQSASLIDTYPNITRLTTGDFNGDNKLDLVAVQTDPYGGSLIKVFLGNGDGSFGAPKDVFGGVDVVTIAPIDLNHDNKLDLLLSNVYDWNAAVLIGNGDGTFGPVDIYPIVGSSEGVTVGDFKNRGFPELLVSDYKGNLFLAHNDGTGHYLNPMSYDNFSGTNQRQPTSLQVGDFNGDGIPDVVTSNPSYQGLRVMTGTGNGRFGPVNALTASNIGNIKATGDFNNDGKLDLVITSTTGSSLAILPGNGDGTFGAVLNTSFSGVTGAAIGDFNNDGKLDLVASTGVTVSVELGNGNGTFQSGVNYNLGGVVTSLVVGDFNNDGKLDLVVASSDNNSITLLTGNGKGTFQVSANPISLSKPLALFSGDFNGDGKPDLVALTSDSLNIQLLIANGNGTFQAPISVDSGFTSGAYVGSYNPTSLTVGDFNGDGKFDLAIMTPFDYTGYNYGVNVLVGGGDGTFQAAQKVLLTLLSGQLIATDLNRDGRVDLVALDPIWGHVDILLNAASACDWRLVDNGLDNGSGQCGTLTQAIQQANLATQPVTISFSSVLTRVNVSSPLPTLSNANGQFITLDGNCTTDANNHKNAGVQLVFANSSGLTLTDRVKLNGIGVSGANSYAVTINGSYNQVSCGTFGQTVDNASLGNGGGLYLGSSASNNLLSDNLIVGNRGVGIAVMSGSKNNQSLRNRIGFDWSGRSLTNLGGGIELKSGGQLVFGPGNAVRN